MRNKKPVRERIYGNTSAHNDEQSDSYKQEKSSKNSQMSNSAKRQLEEFMKQSPVTMSKNLTVDPKKSDKKVIFSKVDPSQLNNSSLNDYDMSDFVPTKTVSSLHPTSQNVS